MILNIIKLAFFQDRAAASWLQIFFPEILCSSLGYNTSSTEVNVEPEFTFPDG
jgi:hypothetical protein